MFALASLNRYQAAGIHLAISTLVAATVLAALLLVWYPQPYFRLAGGPGLMLTLIGVDVVMGPVLTLVVFDPRKKSIRIDLTVIVLLQLAAFAYGLSVIAQARPAYVVFSGDRFTENELSERLGVSRVMVARVEAGLRRPPAALIAALERLGGAK